MPLVAKGKHIKRVFNSIPRLLPLIFLSICLCRWLQIQTRYSFFFTSFKTARFQNWCLKYNILCM